ncbi:hypothetical protein KQI84_00150 [bacterium]|nr:hypothetical protein [bacterium]
MKIDVPYHVRYILLEDQSYHRLDIYAPNIESLPQRLKEHNPRLEQIEILSVEALNPMYPEWYFRISEFKKAVLILLRIRDW